MKLADVRFIKGLLLGILSMVGDGPAILTVALGICALAYTVASMFTTEPTP